MGKTADPGTLLTRFFIFSAGVNRELLNECPRSEWVKYGSIGATVVFTALLAVLSSFFALKLIVDQTFIAILLALLWGGMIYNLDRFLVSSMRKRGGIKQEWIPALPRLILAFAIALVISKPIELKLFESEINFWMEKDLRVQLRAIDQRYIGMVAPIEQERSEVRTYLNAQFARKEAYYAEYRCECDGTCGTGLRGNGSECDRKRIKYESFLQEYALMKQDADKTAQRLEQQQEKLQAAQAEERNALMAAYSTGIRTRLHALHQLPGNTAPWLLFLFFLLEAAPVFTKLLAPRGPYDHVLAEKEYAYQMQWLSAVEAHHQDFEHARRLQALENEIEVHHREVALYTELKANALFKQEKLRNALHLRLLNENKKTLPPDRKSS